MPSATGVGIELYSAVNELREGRKCSGHPGGNAITYHGLTMPPPFWAVKPYFESSESSASPALYSLEAPVCVNLAMANLRRNDARVGKPRGGEAPWGTLVCTCGGRRPFSELVRRNYKRLVEQMSRCKELTWAFRFIFWSIGVKPSREAKGEILN